MDKKEPLRSCVICKTPAARHELIRFVLHQTVSPAKESPGNWTLELDVAGVLDGRGAYCHLRKQCLAAPNFAENLIRSLLCRGKRTLEGVALREPFEKVFERAKEQVERSRSEGHTIAPRILEVMKRLGDFSQSDKSTKVAAKPPKRKIRI